MYEGLPGEYVHGDDIYVDDYYMGELWYYIPNFSNYMISDHGRVWSIKSKIFLKPKRLDQAGHLGFCLVEEGRPHYVYLHRLMAMVFLPNPKNDPIVRHLDDDRENNELENLAWGTQLDNWNDSVRNGTAKVPTDKDREKGFRKTRKPVRATNIKTGRTIRFKSQTDASRRLKIQQSNIWKVLNGQRARAEGWFFEYVRKGDE